MLVIIEHNKKKIWDALLCEESQKQAIYEQLLREIYSVIGDVLVILVSANQSELKMGAPEFPVVSYGRLPFEITVETVTNRFWNAPHRTLEITTALNNRVIDLLREWTIVKQANFAGWQISTAPRFLGAYVVSP